MCQRTLRSAGRGLCRGSPRCVGVGGAGPRRRACRRRLRHHHRTGRLASATSPGRAGASLTPRRTAPRVSTRIRRADLSARPVPHRARGGPRRPSERHDHRRGWRGPQRRGRPSAPARLRRRDDARAWSCRDGRSRALQPMSRRDSPGPRSGRRRSRPRAAEPGHQEQPVSVMHDAVPSIAPEQRGGRDPGRPSAIGGRCVPATRCRPGRRPGVRIAGELAQQADPSLKDGALVKLGRLRGQRIPSVVETLAIAVEVHELGRAAHTSTGEGRIAAAGIAVSVAQVVTGCRSQLGTIEPSCVAGWDLLWGFAQGEAGESRQDVRIRTLQGLSTEPVPLGLCGSRGPRRCGGTRRRTRSHSARATEDGGREGQRAAFAERSSAGRRDQSGQLQPLAASQPDGELGGCRPTSPRGRRRAATGARRPSRPRHAAAAASPAARPCHIVGSTPGRSGAVRCGWARLRSAAGSRRDSPTVRAPPSERASARLGQTLTSPPTAPRGLLYNGHAFPRAAGGHGARHTGVTDQR